MSKLLSKDFVDNRLHPLSHIPETWTVVSDGGKYFELDLKMCQLRSVDYDFHWGDENERQSKFLSAVDTPSRILKLDLSLNELQTLEHDALSPMRNLRDLNASLNKLKSFIGIEILKRLYTLNLSHNAISRVDNLVPSTSLVELNLSMNELTDISYMPSMINLQILNVSNNKLKTLDGVQSLPKLKELYALRNEISDLLPLTGCFHLQVLNLAKNNLTALQSAVGVLSQLKRLEVLTLMGNPLDRDKYYREDILNKTNIMTLDNISVRPLPRQQSPKMDLGMGGSRHIQNINSLKEAARQVFEERMKESREQMAENVHFLQKRIVSLQNEQSDYEEKLKNDLDSCLRYLDSLSSTEMEGINRRRIRDDMGTPHPKVWEGRRTRRRDKPDYRHIKETEDVLRAAQNELSHENT